MEIGGVGGRPQFISAGSHVAVNKIEGNNFNGRRTAEIRMMAQIDSPAQELRRKKSIFSPRPEKRKMRTGAK